MAKELPYFKFEPNDWDNGNIQMLSREDKGLFIDICSMYWSRLGDIPLKLVIQKLCGGNATALNSLCDEKIIEIIDGNIFIKFLSEQLNEFEDVSKQNSKNAKDGWEKRRKQKEESERNATASIPQCENDAIREYKIKEDKIIINLHSESCFSFEEFWSLYPKKVAKDKCKGKYDKLAITDKQNIKKTLSDFVNYKPFKEYTHPNPLTYLNQKRWEDEIIISNTLSNGKSKITDHPQFKQIVEAVRQDGIRR